MALCIGPSLRRFRTLAKHRRHGVAFKRQVTQEFIGGETLHSLWTSRGRLD